MKKYIFTSEEMHCTSCVVLMEEELKNHNKVEKVSAHAGRREVVVEGDFSGITSDELARELTKLVAQYGYKITTAAQREDRVQNSIHSPKEWLIAIPVVVVLLALIKFLENVNILGVLSGAPGGELSLPLVAVVGVVASLSSCLAVTGGLVLAVSQSYARAGATRIPQAMFHIGRLIGFAVFGSLLGYIGAGLTLSITSTMIVQGVLVILMLSMGLNIIGVPFARYLIPTLPKSFGVKIVGVGRMQYRIIPFLLGGLTFFLPCGFTQSMQLYALTSGSPARASLIMLAFALGTLPVLLALSFGSRFVKPTSLGVFYKIAGLMVIIFGLITLRGLLRIIGIM